MKTKVWKPFKCQKAKERQPGVTKHKGPTILLFFWGGGGVILKKKILQVHMRKKKNPAQDHRPKKISHTYSGLEKKFWQDVPYAELLYQQTVEKILAS